MNCCGSIYNHISLVNRVYPSKPGEEGPKSSDLSYLVYYANSKPHKLPKVASYLEKRVKRDIYKGRIGYVKVTLAILNGLINECDQHLNLIATNVLRIVIEVFSSPDPELLFLGTTSFVAFSNFYNHKKIADDEFNAIYSDLVSRFCSYSKYVSTDDALKMKMHLCGLKGIKAIASNKTFLSDINAEKFIASIMPCVLSNIHPGTLSLADSREVLSRRESKTMDHKDQKQSMSSLHTENMTWTDISKIAESCVVEFSVRTTVNSLKWILQSILSYLDSSDQWNDSDFVTYVMKIVISSVQPQFRYIMITSINERLSDESFTLVKSRKRTLAKTLAELIGTAGNAVSTTIMELLENLVFHLLNSVPDNHKAAKASEEDNAVQSSLIESIGSLAFIMHYPEQLNDILAFLATKLQFSISQISENARSTIFRDSIIRCLAQVVQARIQYLNTQELNSILAKRGSLKNIPLCYDLFFPVLHFLRDPQHDVRVDFFMFAYKLLVLENLDTRTPINIQDIKIVSRVQHYLFENVISALSQPVDFVMFGCYFNLVLKVSHLTPAEYIRNLPMIFQLEALIRLGKIPSPSRQRSIGNIVLEYLLQGAEIHKIYELIDYLDQLKQKRIVAHEWAAKLELKVENIMNIRTKQFSDLEGASFSVIRPLGHFVSRETVNQLLLQSCEQDPEIWSDIDNLEARLNEEYTALQQEESMTFKSKSSVKKQIKPAKSSVASSMTPSLPAKPVVAILKSSYSKSRSDVHTTGVRFDDLRETFSMSAAWNNPSETSFAENKTDEPPLDPSNVQDLLNSIQQSLEQKNIPEEDDLGSEPNLEQIPKANGTNGVHKGPPSDKEFRIFPKPLLPASTRDTSRSNMSGSAASLRLQEPEIS